MLDFKKSGDTCVQWVELGNRSHLLGSGYGDSLRLVTSQVLGCKVPREAQSVLAAMGPQGRLFWSLPGNLVILSLEASSLASFSRASAFLPFLLSQ